MSQPFNVVEAAHRNAKEFRDVLTGRKIIGVRSIFDESTLEAYLYIDLDDGSSWSPLRDPEGNGPGFLALMRLAYPRRGTAKGGAK